MADSKGLLDYLNKEVIVCVVILVFFSGYVDVVKNISGIDTDMQHIKDDFGEHNTDIREIKNKLEEMNINILRLQLQVDSMASNLPRASSPIEGWNQNNNNISRMSTPSISINYPKDETKIDGYESHIRGSSSLSSTNAREDLNIYIIAKSLDMYWIYSRALIHCDGTWETSKPCIFRSALLVNSPLEIFAIISDKSYYAGSYSPNIPDYIAKSDSILLYTNNSLETDMLDISRAESF